MNESPRATPDLQTLVALFYDDRDRLAQFDEVPAGSLPPVYRRLLDHHEHMTVTVEAHHRSLVDVRVLQTNVARTHYAREILLTRQTDGQVVQYGIMRVDLAFLSEEIRREIEARRTPLGRILIAHDVHRRVELQSLWRVTPGESLREHFGQPSPKPTFGRTALIWCNGEPAIELLEIVAPIEPA